MMNWSLLRGHILFFPPVIYLSGQNTNFSVFYTLFLLSGTKNWKLSRRMFLTWTNSGCLHFGMQMCLPLCSDAAGLVESLCRGISCLIANAVSSHKLHKFHSHDGKYSCQTRHLQNNKVNRWFEKLPWWLMISFDPWETLKLPLAHFY